SRVSCSSDLYTLSLHDALPISICVITARNPVHSALFLVLAFFTAAGLWMLLRAEFLAIALVLVYVGAVMVLFLFVVMMLDEQERSEEHTSELQSLRHLVCRLLL